MEKPYVTKNKKDFSFKLRCECGRQVELKATGLYRRSKQGIQHLIDVGLRYIDGVYMAQPYKNRSKGPGGR